MNFHPRKKKGFKNCFRNVKLISEIFIRIMSIWKKQSRFSESL
ncbi:hypothetical protein LEP1GSC108_4166 [Leptospira weilii str. UI 13098]|uniref:Uncharacterized protein n=1 Tax=Leptospira weilii str. UI 13098 TaxID=1088542 RepID=M6QPX2_9LEPT|nr:hypothetical protein LEP1GSC108_4166 [Leptospira weilii str. UI 13098]